MCQTTIPSDPKVEIEDEKIIRDDESDYAIEDEAKLFDDLDAENELEEELSIESEIEKYKINDTANSSLYNLCLLLPDSWFINSKNIWNLAGYMYNIPHVCDRRKMIGYFVILSTRTERFSIIKAKEDWKSCKKYKPTLTEAKLKQSAASSNPEKYREWKAIFEPEPVKEEIVKEVKKKKITKQQLEDNEEAMRDEFIDSLIDELGKIDKKIIREDNGIEYEDFLEMNASVPLTSSQLALIIRQTIVRVSNAGDYLYYVKQYATSRYRRVEVKSIEFHSRDAKSFIGYNFLVMHKDEVLDFKLSLLIANIKNYINYRRCEVAPYGVFDNHDNPKMFNLFGGFLHKYDKTFEVNNDLVMLWVNHLKEVWASDDDNMLQYLLKYFKHILVNPQCKTGVVILLKGVQGAGKNLPIDIFIRYVIGPNLGAVVPDMERIVGRFNSIRQSKLMCVLDEAVDNKNKNHCNQLKNLITADEVQIEYKNKEVITLSDFCNYIVPTNHDFASIVEESDRRGLCIYVSPKYKGNEDYFTKMTDSLLNVEAGKHIFHWLINNVSLENFKVSNPPNTSYKQELKLAQANSVIQFLHYTYDNIKVSEQATEVKLYATQFYNDYKGFCDNYKMKAMSGSAFGRILKNRENPLDNGRDSHGYTYTYSYPVLLKFLRNYL